ncbi:MAG: lyase family protein [Thiothrix litoralis]|jgi:fumarate hydratase class II|uniref:lyase family protein n=1 Tax=Thiothrix litoralis TaxID=2891210 RepID=UPI003C78DD9F
MNNPARIETDTLGEVNFPQEAFYGHQTQAAVENVAVSGLTMPRSFLRALGLFKYACAAANQDLARLDDERAQAIQKVALEVAQGLHDPEFGMDIFQMGDGSIMDSTANNVITRYAQRSCRLPVNSHHHVNHSQQTDRTISACMQVAVLLDIHEQLLPAQQKLVDTLVQDASPLVTQVKTSWQTIRQFVNWSAQIQQAIKQIKLASLTLSELPMGNHEPFDTEFIYHLPAYLNNQTRLKFCVQSNPLAGITPQDRVVAISGQLRILALNLMHICQEVESLQQNKQSEQEAAVMACVQVIGNDAAITLAAQLNHSGSRRMVSVITYNLLQSISLLSSAAHLLADRTFSNVFNLRHPNNANTHKE